MIGSKEYYDKYWGAGLDDWSARGISVDPAERRIIDLCISAGDTVVEIGCGDGRIGSYVVHHGPAGVRYTGLDISSAAVELCRQKGLEATVHDLQEQFPLDGETADRVLCFEVLEHMNRPDACVAEMARILRTDGRLVGSVPNVAFLPNRLLMLLGRFNPGGAPSTSMKAPWRDPHIRFFSVSALKAMILDDHLFANVEVSGSPFRLTDFPKLYKAKGGLRRVLNILEWPFGFLGCLWPSLFASRLFFIARH